jgi:hypothetical protein
MNNPFSLPYRWQRHISDSYKRFSERQIEFFTSFFQPQILRGLFQCPRFYRAPFCYIVTRLKLFKVQVPNFVCLLIVHQNTYLIFNIMKALRSILLASAVFGETKAAKPTKEILLQQYM